MTRFEGETFSIDRAGTTVTVEALSGWRCAACRQVQFDADSARHYAAAGDGLVLRDRERKSKGNPTHPPQPWLEPGCRRTSQRRRP